MSEIDPNPYSKVVDDRPLILAPHKDDLFVTGVDPLICRSKRELDSECGMINSKLVSTSRILTFKCYMVVILDQIWEMPLSFINSITLRFLENSRHMFCS